MPRLYASVPKLGINQAFDKSREAGSVKAGKSLKTSLFTKIVNKLRVEIPLNVVGRKTYFCLCPQRSGQT
jgi:hypothetical protein